MPIPPESTGLVMEQGPSSSNNMLYSAITPATLPFPPGGICGDSFKIVIVGAAPEDNEDYPEIVLRGATNTEALHIKLGILEDVLWRWAVLNDTIGPVENVGEEGDGTTIDFDEPFLLEYYNNILKDR